MAFGNWKARAGELKWETLALYLCTRHPRTPLHTKLLASLLVCYALSPIDLIPDFIPILGYVDDLVLIPLGIALLIKMMPKDILEECRREARSFQASRHQRWMGAVIVILVWTIVAFVTFRIISWVF